MADRLERLFQPVTLGALALRNRIVMSPMTRSRAGAGDAPTHLHQTYYAQRASSGLIITEGVQPSPDGKGYCRTPGLYSPSQIAGWAGVAGAVHAKGGLIVAQLMHCGRVGAMTNKCDGSELVAPSAIRANSKIFTDSNGLVDMGMPRALSTGEVVAVVEQYRQAAINARAAELDGVELHASSGYLPMQFLSTNTNRRTDRYGGTVRNRVRFVVEVLEAMASAIGAERVGMRISPGLEYNDIRDADPIETYDCLLNEVSPLGLAYVHLVRGKAEGRDNLELVARRWRGKIILNNGLTASGAEDALRAGDADAISFGRDFIANPDLVTRLRRGKPLAAFDRDRLYTPGPEGYIDYPCAT